MKHSVKKDNRLLPKLAVILCAVAFSLFTIPTQAQQSIQVLHNHVRPVVSSGQAVPVGVMPSTQRLNLAIQLPLRNESELDSFLARLYDPTSPDYRKFLTVAEFTERFGPMPEDYQAVVAFAKTNGFKVTNTPANRLLVDVNGTVAQINKAFHVVMTLYQHPTENRTFFSPDREPSVNLNVPVLHIAGLDNYSIPRPLYTRAPGGKAAQSNFGSGPGGSYLGGDMRAAYYGTGPLDGTGQSVGLLEYDGYNLTDVVASFDGVPNSVPINNVLIDGASAGSDGDDGEQVLDIVQAATMAPGLNQVRVYIIPLADIGDGVVDVDAFNSMATENICKQLSSSWWWLPEDASSDDPIFKEFAAQGQALFDATGDVGAYTGTDRNFPATDPYLVAVGGTDLTTTGPGGSWVAETAWVYSSGGPSELGFPIPSWQVGVANSSNQASTTLRNVPDVAMEGNNDNYSCDQGLCYEDFGGTSFAAPRWAGFIALVNQQAAEIAQSPVGFIDPAIYLIGQSSLYNNDFHDITSGNNDCCGQSVFYNAVTGYDLVTGWGSPTGPDLIYSLLGVYPPTITSANNTAFTVGTAGSFLVTATGYPGVMTFTASGQPSFVTLSSSGVLSGTPPAGSGGTYTFTITASNGVAPNAVQTFTLTVDQAPIITSANHTTFTVGMAGLFTVTATGFPAPTFTASGTLPVGVTLSSSGVLSGTPAAGTGGVYTLSITASNGVSPNASQLFTLTVDQAPAITSANGTTFTTGKPGSFQVTATGYPAPTFTETGTLPSGVTFSSSGLLSGTPATGTGGIYAITIYASNGVAPVASQLFTLTVDQPPTITSANHTTFTVGKPGSFQVTATGFPTTITFSYSGTLPIGVSLSPSGLLSGIPATGGTYPITIYASNGVLPNAAQNFKLTVDKEATTCVLNSSSNLFTNGEPIIFTATVTSNGTITPNGGTVTFIDNTTYQDVLGKVPLVDGTASLTAVLQAPPDRQTFIVVYSGDSSFKSCKSPYIAENYE